MNIEKIKTEGFLLNEACHKVDDVASLSLNLSFKSYFSTYRSVDYYLILLSEKSKSEEEKDCFYTIDYIENACEAIFHFQHFVELIIKDILHNEHELLLIDASKAHDLLYDLVKGKKYDNKDLQRASYIGYSLALERLVALIEKNRLDKNMYGFIEKANEWLRAINHLRNRIVHRGVFVLRYEALDYLFGKYIFPFVIKVASLPAYKKDVSFKRFLKNDLGIDPVKEIVKHFAEESYSLNKVSLLKEIGRASAENPLLNRKYVIRHDDEIKKRAELIARSLVSYDKLNVVKLCPICNTNSLVVYKDCHFDMDEQESYDSSYRVKCFCCSFELDNKIGDINKMN
ncbi:MAG TPA: hypothetical protein VMW01_10485 [Williamwhitmania sp.]|nr:hypothetical protein [Williamwhitmania sp.]